MTREEAIALLNCTATEMVGTLGEGGDVSAVNQSLRYIEALDMAIAALREQPRWISVEERPPEDDVDVLTRRATGMSVESHCGFGWAYDEYNGKWRVTHWMPLPEPPEVEV